MTKPNDGGPAFPRTVQNWNGSLDPEHGMSKRDYIAVHALAGILVHPTRYRPREGGDWRSDVAEEAVSLADAMIAALGVKP